MQPAAVARIQVSESVVKSRRCGHCCSQSDVIVLMLLTNFLGFPFCAKRNQHKSLISREHNDSLYPVRLAAGAVFAEDVVSVVPSLCRCLKPFVTR